MKIHQSKFLKNMKGCSLAYLHERVCTETESKDPEDALPTTRVCQRTTRAVLEECVTNYLKSKSIQAYTPYVFQHIACLYQ